MNSVKRINAQVDSIEFTARNPLKPGTLDATAFQLAQRAIGVTVLELADVLRAGGIKRDPDIPIKYAESIYRLKQNSKGRPAKLPAHLSIRKQLMPDPEQKSSLIPCMREGYQIYRIWDRHKRDWY